LEKLNLKLNKMMSCYMVGRRVGGINGGWVTVKINTEKNIKNII